MQKAIVYVCKEMKTVLASIKTCAAMYLNARINSTENNVCDALTQFICTVKSKDCCF